MLTPDGFPGQRMLVLPRPLVAQALTRPITQRLLVTDVGYFPRAARHGRLRPAGAEELIVVLCVDGGGEIELDGRTYVVSAGKAVVIPAGVPHLYRADEADPWTIWWCHLAGEAVASLIEPLGETRLIALSDLFRAVDTMNRMMQAMQRDETYASLVAAAGDAWSLITQLVADHLTGSRGQVEPIRAAQDHLRERLADPVSVPELAKLAGLSTSHFTALFRRATGGGVVTYAKSLRMARARELLDTTTRPVNEIAAEVGYPDPFYFARHFRTVHQVTPTQYRNRH